MAAAMRCAFDDQQGPAHTFHAATNIDCSGQTVTWQRGDWMIALACRSDEPGRLLVGAPAPLSLDVARSIHAHSQVSFMGEPYDSFAAARVSCGNAANFYRREAGAVSRHWWEHGLGMIEQDGKRVRDPAYPPITSWLSPNQLAMQVAIAEGFAGGLSAQRNPGE
jgi:hypothetical protein